MSDAEVRVLEARLDEKYEHVEAKLERALRLLDGNGDGAMARIGYMEKQWEARLVAEEEVRVRAREDRMAEHVANQMAVWKRYTMGTGAFLGFLAGAYEAVKFIQSLG